MTSSEMLGQSARLCERKGRERRMRGLEYARRECKGMTSSEMLRQSARVCERQGREENERIRACKEGMQGDDLQ